MMISPKRAKLSPEHTFDEERYSILDYEDEEDEDDILLGTDPIAEISE